MKRREQNANDLCLCLLRTAVAAQRAGDHRRGCAVLVVQHGDRVLIVRREEKLLGGLYVFPDILEETDPAKLCAHMEAMGVPCAYDEPLGHARHVFTHLIWEMDIHALTALAAPELPGMQWVTREELAALPLPTAGEYASRALRLERARGELCAEAIHLRAGKEAQLAAMRALDAHFDAAPALEKLNFVPECAPDGLCAVMRDFGLLEGS